MSTLKLAWATHEAAKYACENWHYSEKIPVSKLSRIGVWEDGKFIGVIVFGAGASANLHKSFSVGSNECCELVRIALTRHSTSVTRIVSIAFQFLRQANPKLRVCVSFADPAQNHIGVIYQAGNWIFTGETAKQIQALYKGKWVHVRSIYHRIPDAKFEALAKRSIPGKYRYVMPLDAEMRKQVMAQSKPYPKKDL